MQPPARPSPSPPGRSGGGHGRGGGGARSWPASRRHGGAAGGAGATTGAAAGRTGRRHAASPGASGEPASAERAARRGIAAAAVCAGAIALLWAVTVPAYWAVDELSHIAYARTVAEGRLPLIDTPIGDAGVAGLDARLAFERAVAHTERFDIWTANHPPLHYALAAVPLRLGEAAGASGPGLLGARLVAVLAVVAGVALTGALARLLVPDRPRLAVAAAALAGLTPSLGHFGGLLFNDALSFALCALVAVTAVRALRDGPGGWRLTAVAAAGTAAALTRVSTLPLLALAAVACAVGAWRAAGAGASRGRRAWTGARAGAVAGLAPAVGAGWFYARNLVHYGDLTGSAALLDKFERDPNASLGRLLVDGSFYVNQWDRLLADLSTGVWTVGWRIPVIRALGVLLLAGAALGAWRWARGRPGGGGAVEGAVWLEERRLADVRWRRTAWLLLLAFPLLLLVATARFHAEGGSPHARYLLAGLAVLALLGACSLERLGRAGMLAGVGGFLTIAFGAWVDYLRWGDEEWVLDGRAYRLPTPLGEDATTVVAGMVLVVIAVAAVVLVHSLAVRAPGDRAGRTG